MRTLSLFSLLTVSVVAQIPNDAVLVLESTTALYVPNYRVVDAFGGGSTTLRNQNVFLLPSPVSVAIDPIEPQNFHWLANTASLPGVWRTEVGLLASIQLSTWGPWLQAIGDRVECGAVQVFTLRAGLVEASGRALGSPGFGSTVPLFALPGAADLAANSTHLYVASNHGGLSPLVEYDLTTGVQRTVGSYWAVRAVAVSPIASELCLADFLGDLHRIDISTGAVIATTNTGLGPLVAVGYTSLGTLVWANPQQVWSELVPGGPIYTTPTTIVDFAVSRTPTASVVPFGRGCGVGAAANWSANTQPTLGNAAFTLALQNAPGSAFAVLVLGGSRLFAASWSVPLPFDLGPLGAPGCALLVDPAVLLLHATTAAGGASQVVPIPANPSLAGIEFVAQWFVPDAGIAPLGLAATEGVAFVPR